MEEVKSCFRIVEFSSQYGGETSCCYSASNIRGDPKVYPKYGDYTETFAARYYGAIRPQIFSPVSPADNYYSSDYIDVALPTALYPAQLDVYETYNPGSVVRVLAFSGDPLYVDHFTLGVPRPGNSRRSSNDERPDKRSQRAEQQGPLLKVTLAIGARPVTCPLELWAVLWTGQPQFERDAPQACRLQLTLADCPFPTRMLRLEFCTADVRASYYSEIDAIQVRGSASARRPFCELELHWAGQPPVPTVDTSPSVGALCPRCSKLQIFDKPAALVALPTEVLERIVGLLDLRSLCRLSRTCRRFRAMCYDARYYQKVNLQPFWHRMTDTALLELQKRCGRLRMLDFSWCGAQGLIDSRIFSFFLKSCCLRPEQLTSLRLSCCNFLDAACLDTICRCCCDLRELDLSGVRSLQRDDFRPLGRLRSLRAISLYRTKIATNELIQLLTNGQLLSIDLGNCHQVDFNAALPQLANHCRQLVYLNLWRAKCDSEHMIEMAMKLECLQEVDLGWMTDAVTPQVVAELANKCGASLRKLGLCACRKVSDDCLQQLATNCPQLQSLDVLGNALITNAGCERLLGACKQLSFIDVSFCFDITNDTLERWRDAYPLVTFKYSFQQNSGY